MKVNTVREANRARVTAAALALGAVALLAVIAPHVQAHGSAPHAAPSADAGAPVVNRWGANYFPNVELVTQDGKTVRLYDDLLKGKSVAINVMFTDCKDVCPLETAMLAQLQKKLGPRVGKDIFLYSISIDPKNDTPKVLKAYAEKYGAGPGWLFLTGKADDLKLVTRKLGLLRTRDLETRDGHASTLVVGNEPSGQWTRNSALDNPEFLAGRIGAFLGWRDMEGGKSYAEAKPLDFKDAQYLFQSRCSACHTIGQGDKVGPDLAGVTARRERGWLARYIRVPDQVLAERDPIAVELYKRYKQVRMTNIGLAPHEVSAIVSYVDGQTKALRDKERKALAPAR
jgi:protein SCO1/2